VGLYLCIFDGDEEIDGVEVGSYADYGWFIDTVIRELEGGRRGSQCPTLTLHSDCDGEWSVAECVLLERELRATEEALRGLPPIPFNSEWQTSVARGIGYQCRTLYDCFLDVDGEPMIERLMNLCRRAQQVNQPILFQ